MRMKNIRSVPSRCAIVAGATAGLFWPGRDASQGLNASMCARVISARPVMPGAASARNAAKHRRAWSVFATLPGRSTQAICSR
jgi:hypothetical protein